MALRHLAIIMDGNRRWARANHLAVLRGHNKGAETLKDVAKAAMQEGIAFLTCFAFSTENWKRPQDEVSGLINLMHRFLMRDLSELLEENICLKVIGDITAFSEEMQALIRQSEEKTAHNDGLKLTLAVNYGGLSDIAQAAELTDFSGAIDAEDKVARLKANLYTSSLPPVDMLVRTGGEKRISNFLLFDLAYAELYFTDVLWPEFSQADLLAVIHEYQKRDRRFGADSQSVIAFAESERAPS